MRFKIRTPNPRDELTIFLASPAWSCAKVERFPVTVVITPSAIIASAFIIDKLHPPPGGLLTTITTSPLLGADD